MTNTIQNKILKALFAALKPMAKAMLRAGIGYKEFSEVSKAAFVHEAATEYGVRGRPTNISRIAVMTGITRKEIKRIRDNDADQLLSKALAEGPASVILSRWYTDPRFCDEEGMPLELEYNHGDNSFVQLVANFAGDIPPGAMRTELKRTGAISEDANKRLKVLKRYFVPSGVDERLEIGLGDVVGADLDTLAFNCDPNREGPARYHRVTSIDVFHSSYAPSIAKEATTRLTEVANQFDDYLETAASSENIADKAADKKLMQIGIGMFFFERNVD